MQQSAELKFANRLGYTDVEPYEVVRVVSDKTLEVRAMKAERDPSWKPNIIPGGFSGHCTNQQEQRWIITQDDSAPVFRVRKHKDGLYYHGEIRFSLSDKPQKFYDYNF